MVSRLHLESSEEWEFGPGVSLRSPAGTDLLGPRTGGAALRVSYRLQVDQLSLRRGGHSAKQIDSGIYAPATTNLRARSAARVSECWQCGIRARILPGFPPPLYADTGTLG
jgi:hypothetical protein